jgi:hypothetical protein
MFSKSLLIMVIAMYIEGTGLGLKLGSLTGLSQLQ